VGKILKKVQLAVIFMILIFFLNLARLAKSFEIGKKILKKYGLHLLIILIKF
jgi:hypothetical protein